MTHYQMAAQKSAIYNKLGTKSKKVTDNLDLLYATLGLNGEAGEVAEEVKKMIRDDNGILTEDRRHRLLGELGDTLWYLSAVAHEAGLDLGEVACYNLKKLRSRYGIDKD